jgi:membrane protein
VLDLTKDGPGRVPPAISTEDYSTVGKPGGPLRVLRVVQSTIEAFGRDNGTTLAAAIAYYTLLSIFPLILGLLALLGAIVGGPVARDRFIVEVAALFPGAAPLITSTVTQVVIGRGAAGIVATVGLIWSASGVFGGISLALNQVWQVKQQRNFVVNAVLAVGLVIAVGLIFMVSLVLTAGLRLAETFNLPLLGGALGQTPFLFPLLGLLLPLLITLGVIAGIFRWIPHVHLTWRYVWPGALFAAVLVEIGKQAFALYLGSFANLNAVYGPIGAVIALVTWAYYMAIVLILGAELNAVLAGVKQEAAPIVLPRLDFWQRLRHG